MKRFLLHIIGFYLLGSAAHTRRLIRTLSGCWILFTAVFLLFEMVSGSNSRCPLLESLSSEPLGWILAFYFVFAFCTSFSRRRSPVLLFTGILSHGLLAVFLLHNAAADPLGPLLVGFAAYFAAAWFWLFVKLERSPAAELAAAPRPA